MSRLDDTSPEFQALLAAACGEDATPEQLQALERMAENPAAMRLLVDYVQMDVELRRLVRRQFNADKCLAGLGITVDAASCRVMPGTKEERDGADVPEQPAIELPPASGFPQLGPGPFALPSPPPGLLGGAWRATADFFEVGGLPFSYLVGTVIFAAALWGTSWITVFPSEPSFARQSGPSGTDVLPEPAPDSKHLPDN